MSDVSSPFEIVDLGLGDPRLVDEAYPVLAELRPHLTAEQFVELYERGFGQRLRFTAAYDRAGGGGGVCVGVAGWRIVDTTASVRKLYVDDLVTAEARRGEGVGRALLAALEARGREAGCTMLDLDSGTHRVRAHAFYFREGLAIKSFHFSKQL